jgi:hypothetical protein
MANPSNLNDIIQRILNGNQTDDDVEALRQWLISDRDKIFILAIALTKDLMHKQFEKLLAPLLL